MKDELRSLGKDAKDIFVFFAFLGSNGYSGILILRLILDSTNAPERIAENAALAMALFTAAYLADLKFYLPTIDGMKKKKSKSKTRL